MDEIMLQNLQGSVAKMPYSYKLMQASCTSDWIERIVLVQDDHHLMSRFLIRCQHSKRVLAHRCCRQRWIENLGWMMPRLAISLHSCVLENAQKIEFHHYSRFIWKLAKTNLTGKCLQRRSVESINQPNNRPIGADQNTFAIFREFQAGPFTFLFLVQFECNEWSFIEWP